MPIAAPPIIIANDLDRPFQAALDSSLFSEAAQLR